MKALKLADLKDYTAQEIGKHLISEYGATRAELKALKILIAYESVGSWGCDSSSFFLFQHKGSKRFMMLLGSHCSCHGFEEQWGDLEKTTLEYLKSSHFYFNLGGYDDDDGKHEGLVKSYMKKLRRI